MSNRLPDPARREAQAEILDTAADAFRPIPSRETRSSRVRPEFIANLARKLGPDASDAWLRGLEIAILARPEATEADLASIAEVLAAEADGYERGVSDTWREATIELQRRKDALQGEIATMLRTFAVEITGDPDIELESLCLKAKLN